MIRSFLAIDLPDTVKEIITGYLRDLRRVPSQVKWVSPQQIHLTLKFFGSIPVESIETISQTLTKVVNDYERFHLTLKGIGAFPNLFRPRVIWAGLQGDINKLLTLQQGLEQTLSSLGIAKEDRPFHPHLTLGRNKGNQVNEPLYKLLSGWPAEESPSFPVEEFVLFKSDLKPSGPVYTKLGIFPLKER